LLLSCLISFLGAQNFPFWLPFKSGLKGRYTRGSLLPQRAPATRSRSKAPSSAPTISSGKMLRNKTSAPEFCTLTSNWFNMRKQAPGANLLHDSVSGASSLVCTEICSSLTWRVPYFFSSQSGCFINQLLRRVLHEYWLGRLPGSVFLERVSGASFLVCTGLITPGDNRNLVRTVSKLMLNYPLIPAQQQGSFSGIIFITINDLCWVIFPRQHEFAPGNIAKRDYGG